MDETSLPTVPQARIEPATAPRWRWVIPAGAVVLSLALIGMYVVKRGPVITVSMRHGYGLKNGDVVRSRGIVVGQVEQVALTAGLDGVEAKVRLQPGSPDLSRAGSRFWVVRPTVTLGGVGGLETIAGPRYMAVIPGPGERRSRFVALDDPPVVEAIEPDALEIMLDANRRGSLRPGAPIMYRQVVVGTVLSVGLSSDASSVEVRAYIRPAYANLVRTNSRFWNASGVGVQATLTGGLRFDLESLQSLVEGGISFATDERDPGQTVHTGHRFELAEKAEDAWLRWRPLLAVGGDLLPAGAARPIMQRLTVNRRAGLLRRLTRTQPPLTGWALPVAEGLLGPSTLLQPDQEDARRLEVAGQEFDLSTQSIESRGPLSLLRVSLKSVRIWPEDRIGVMEKPEDCLIAADPAAPPVPLPATRLRRTDSVWRIEPGSYDDSFNGAAVLAQADGRVVGILLVEGGTGTIVPARAMP